MEHLEQKQKIMIMLAIMSAMLFAALNQTIVSTALPKIVSELEGLDYISWVFTIYMLASSVTAILVGKLSDIYGRKPFILIGMGIFVVGSLLAGISDTIFQLIAFRGVQGFGAGMIMSTSFTAVGDLFSPRERGRWQGLMGGVFGLASVFGPTLGGYIVDYYHWAWVFWIFLPFGIVAFALIWNLFPTKERQEAVSVDYAGSVFLTTTIVPLLLAFSWAGSKYDWTSMEVIGLFTASVISLAVFIWIERRSESPILPLALFKNSIFSLSNAIGFFMGAGMFGAIMYMPFFVQGVIGTSATASGFVMMPMTLSMVLASAIGGQIITKTGKYKWQALIGLLVMSLGMFSLSVMNAETTNTTAVINMIIVGLGLGLSFPIFTLTVQNAVEQKMLGVATASSQLFRQIGGTIGVSIMGTVMSYRMTDELQRLSEKVGYNTGKQVSPELAEKLAMLKNPQVLMDPDKLVAIQASLPGAMKEMFAGMIQILREALGYSLSGVFIAGATVVLSAFVLTFFLKEIPLRKSNQEPASEDKLQPQPQQS